MTPLSIENIKLIKEANIKLVNNTLRPLLLKCVRKFRKVKEKAGRGFVDIKHNQPFQRILLSSSTNRIVAARGCKNE